MDVTDVITCDTHLSLNPGGVVCPHYRPLRYDDTALMATDDTKLFLETCCSKLLENE